MLHSYNTRLRKRKVESKGINEKASRVLEYFQQENIKLQEQVATLEMRLKFEREQCEYTQQRFHMLQDQLGLDRNICSFYLFGDCNKGLLCENNHPNICFKHIRNYGSCSNEDCKYAHIKIKGVCYFWMTNGCNYTENCKNKHPPCFENRCKSLNYRQQVSSNINNGMSEGFTKITI